MSTTPNMQESGPESLESMMGDGVPLNGTEAQAARRVHMRELTMARQAAEQRLSHPPIRRGSEDFHEQVAERVAEVRTALARINVEHKTWLLLQDARPALSGTADAVLTLPPYSPRLLGELW